MSLIYHFEHEVCLTVVVYVMMAVEAKVYAHTVFIGELRMFEALSGTCFTEEYVVFFDILRAAAQFALFIHLYLSFHLSGVAQAPVVLRYLWLCI